MTLPEANLSIENSLLTSLRDPHSFLGFRLCAIYALVVSHT
jgi:hypothetical protein